MKNPKKPWPQARNPLMSTDSPVYQNVLRSGNIKIYALIGLIFLNTMILVAFYGWYGRMGLPIGLAVGGILSAILLYTNEARRLRELAAKPISGHDAWDLCPITKQLSDKIRVEQPSSWVFNHPCPFLLALGSKTDSHHLAFSSTLIERLDPEDLRAAVALGLALINERRSLYASLSLKLIFVLGTMVARTDRLTFGYLSKALGPVYSWLTRGAIGHRTYYRADAAAARALGNEMAVAKVLVKLDFLLNCHIEPIPHYERYALIAGPTHSPIHPPTSERVRRLVGHYPI